MTEPSPTPGIAAADADALRELLAAERERTRVRVAELTRDFDTIVESSALETPDDEHDPEGSTIGFERAQVSALAAQAREHLAELERALARLAEGTYGTCERCGRPIALERLRARPTARTCIDCASGRRRSR